MLEAANARPRFTISLKRSTQNLQLSTSCSADYPIYRLYPLRAKAHRVLRVSLEYRGARRAG
jgi:hypothetical protein